jgi:hypothetical protein
LPYLKLEMDSGCGQAGFFQFDSGLPRITLSGILSPLKFSARMPSMRVFKPFIAICIILAGFLVPATAGARQPDTTEPLATLPATGLSAVTNTGSADLLPASISNYDNQPNPASFIASVTTYDAMPCMAIINRNPSQIQALPPCPNPFLANTAKACNHTYDAQPSYS